MSEDSSKDPALPFTGERFTPECVREIWYEHWHRYALAATLAGGKEVLDVASGEGYGSALLAQSASSVTGVDIDGEAVAHARQRYGELANLTFEQDDCAHVPLKDQCMDLVVSFETLEHIEAQAQMLRECRRVLREDGVLMISTPDKTVYSEVMGSDNEFHVRELERDEFVELLKKEFPAVKLLGQKLLFVSALWDEGGNDGPWRVSCQADAPGKQPVTELERVRLVREQQQMPWSAVYHVALCAADESLLPETPGLHLFGDEAESVYRHYNQEVGNHIRAGLIIQDRDRTIEALRAELARAKSAGNETGNRNESWWRRWFGSR